MDQALIHWLTLQPEAAHRSNGDHFRCAQQAEDDGTKDQRGALSCKTALKIGESVVNII